MAYTTSSRAHAKARSDEPKRGNAAVSRNVYEQKESLMTTHHHVFLRATVAACCVLSGCAASPDKRFRTALEQSREIRNPALTGEVDPVVAEGFVGSLSTDLMGTIRLASYSPARACFLGQLNLPPEVVQNVAFRLEGYRTTEDFPERGQIITTRAVEVLGSGALQVRVHQLEVQTVTRSAVILRDNPVDRSVVQTGVSICFDRPTVPSKDTTFMVLRPDPAALTDVPAFSWRLVPAKSARGR